MPTYDDLPKMLKESLESVGKAQGLSPPEVEQQYNDAQAVIHGNPSAYQGHALTRGFKSRGA